MRSQRERAGLSGCQPGLRRPGLGTGLLTMFAALAIAASATVRASAPADLFDDIYRRGQPMEQSLKTIRAHFTESTTSSLLVKPVVAEGTLLAVRPSDILLSYTKPEKKLLRIDATTLRFVWPDRNLRESRDIRESQSRVQKYFVDKTPDELRRHFAITATNDTTRAGTWRLEMLPKRKQIQQGVTKIELWIDQRTSILSAMTLTFAGGDTKTMTFTNVEVNAPITLADLGLPSAG
ncbi:MAG: outer membrane lipoprotein carrier protein LolA [Vicinamibacteraceae bacterium]